MDCIEEPGYRPSRRWYLLPPAILLVGVFVVLVLGFYSGWHFVNFLWWEEAPAMPSFGDAMIINQPGTYTVSLDFGTDDRLPPDGFDLASIHVLGRWDNGDPVQLTPLPSSDHRPYELVYKLEAGQTGTVDLDITHDDGFDVPLHSVGIGAELSLEDSLAGPGVLVWIMVVLIVSVAAALATFTMIFLRRHTNL